MSILELVANQASPDNNKRIRAEVDFKQTVAANPNAALHQLLELAKNASIPEDVRQLCLLHIRRLVPMYWSLAFESFVGPPTDQELKAAIRHDMIRIATTAPESKLRSGASYVISQIAAVDYPDEWPDLLATLYRQVVDGNDIAIAGSLGVLHELFDDLITDDQFWEGGVGSQMVSHISNLLKRPDTLIDVKIASLRLYQSIVTTLKSPEAFSTAQRKAGAKSLINEAMSLFSAFLKQPLDLRSTLTSYGYLHTFLYRLTADVVSSFLRKISPVLIQETAHLLLRELQTISIAFQATNLSTIDDNINALSLEYLRALSAVEVAVPFSDIVGASYPQSLQQLLVFGILSMETVEDYVADFNSFVTDITGFSSTASAREGLYELLSELGPVDASQTFTSLVDSLNQEAVPQLRECQLYAIESLCTNEEALLADGNDSAVAILESVTRLILTVEPIEGSSLVNSRCFLVIPKLLEKLQTRLNTSFASKCFLNMVSFLAETPSNLQEEVSFSMVKCASLTALTFYHHFTNFEGLDRGQKGTAQFQLAQTIASLVEDSEEDSLPSLLEALTVAINLDKNAALQTRMSLNDLIVSVIDLIFRISFKDPGNIQLAVDSTECLQSVLAEVDLTAYLNCCKDSVPFIMNLLRDSISKGGEYSPQVDLALELLSVIIKEAPTNSGNFPKEVFEYIMPDLSELLMLSTDNQIMQTGGQVLDSLLQRASESFLVYRKPQTNEAGTDLLMGIVGKLLSPQLSDSAAMNCGPIVLSLIQNFQPYLGDDFLAQILDAVTRRLVVAKEVVTIEGLIQVFCHLVLTSPNELVDYMYSRIRLTDLNGTEKNGLELVMPMWFLSFEITRGYEKIKQNALALGKIFTLADPRIENMIVDGDIIPYEGDVIRTRSMTKANPDRYTQISASLKILKLLASELSFQNQQPDANGYLPEIQEDDNDDGDDWEDMGDLGVPNYAKLKSYIESDDESDHDGGSDGSLKEMLEQFFRECASKNLGNFETYYNNLDEDEKKIITESVVF